MPVNSVGLEHGALPVALLHSRSLEKSDGFHSEARRSLKDAAYELGSWKSQDEVDSEPRRRIAVNVNLDVESVPADGEDLASTYSTSQDTDFELVSYLLLEDFSHMSDPLVFDSCNPCAHEVSVAEKEEIHGFAAAAAVPSENDAANRRKPSSIDTRGS